MATISRGIAAIACAATIVGVTAGVAGAATPQPSPAGPSVPVPLHKADALANYNAAGAAQIQQAGGAALGGGLAGAAIGGAVGCVAGGAAGLVLPLSEVALIPFGCIGGAIVGGGIGAQVGYYGVINATEPNVMAQCEAAMPA